RAWPDRGNGENARRNRRPRKQRLVASHARGLAGGENNPAKAGGQHVALLRRFTIQQPPQTAPGAPYSDVKGPKLGIDGAHLVEAHFVNQFLEDQWVVG